jgi:hypothetical protein
MPPPKKGEPRAHHYVPRSWLAGFTDTSLPDGRLFVTDLSRNNQWSAKPGNAGFIRDFYRLEDEQASDPLIVEKGFSKIEDEVAPILRAIEHEHRKPRTDEIEPLLFFMAIQWSRVPAFRPFVLNVLDKFSYEQLSKELASPETWAKCLAETGISPDAPGADYEKMKRFHEEKAYTLSAPTDWYVKKSFEFVERIGPSLMKRYWTPLVSPSGSFIASDNPVVLEGPVGTMVGFENAETITYPLTRHVALIGTLIPIELPTMNRTFVAHFNTLSMLKNDAQIFSHTPDFCWIDETGKYQTDWKLFSKEKYTTGRTGKPFTFTALAPSVFDSGGKKRHRPQRSRAEYEQR